MASSFTTAMYVLGLLVCGSLNTITMKIAFTMTGINTDGEEQIFQKPWFITWVMFAAMTFSLPFDKTLWRKSPPPSCSMESSLIDSPSQESRAMPWAKKVKMVSIPAVFDIMATGLCSMGFLYIPASVWQLLRGAEMVFAALFAVTFLRRKLYPFHWIGVGFCVTGIILVGLASVWGTPQDSSSTSGGMDTILLGMGLCLAGQVVQAAQVIAEEWLLTDFDLPGLQIVGFEGMWGSFIMLFIVFPLLYVIPGSDRGHLEDELDAFTMIGSDGSLLGLMLLFAFSCATYNMSGIAVTGALSAVHRVMLEAFRTSIVWVFGLMVHYYYDPESKFGEAWTPYSRFEVFGFLILMLGQAVYGEMIRIPGLAYPKTKPAAHMLATPGNLRVLGSPLPNK